MIGPLCKRLTKDGGLRGQEEGDASFRGARMQTKTHNGKGLIHDDSQHGANKDKPLLPLYNNMTKTAPMRVTRHRNRVPDLRFIMGYEDS